jgi:hypothetical protein
MATLETNYIKGVTPQPIPSGAEVISIKAELVGLDDLADNDMLAMCFLPEDCVPVDAVIVHDDLDDGAGLAVDFGLFNADEDAISTEAADGGDEWVDGSTALQAAGVLKMTTGAIWRTQPSTSRRKVGFKVMVDPATDPAATQKLSVIFSYRAAHQGL